MSRYVKVLTEVFEAQQELETDALQTVAKLAWNLAEQWPRPCVPTSGKRSKLLNSIVYSSHARHVSIRFDCSCVVR